MTPNDENAATCPAGGWSRCSSPASSPPRLAARLRPDGTPARLANAVAALDAELPGSA